MIITTLLFLTLALPIATLLTMGEMSHERQHRCVLALAMPSECPGENAFSLVIHHLSLIEKLNQAVIPALALFAGVLLCIAWHLISKWRAHARDSRQKTFSTLSRRARWRDVAAPHTLGRWLARHLRLAPPDALLWAQTATD